MSSVVKKIIAIVVVVAVIGGIVFYKVMDNKVYYNDSPVNGNTIGNLYGNGLFCEIDGIVFFANPNDDNALYSMSPDESDYKKICDDRVYYINADSHYIYYSRDRNNDESQMSFLNVNVNSLCRINHNGKKIKILDDAICSTLALSKNTLYYHHYDTDDATTLYSIGIDGKDKKQYNKAAVDPRCIVGESLYYSGVESDHNIHRANLAQSGASTVCNEWAWMPTVVGDKLYYMDLNNGDRITCMNMSDGSTEVVSVYGTTDYNVVGNTIYYQTVKAETDGLYKIDLNNGTEELIAQGQFNSINTTSRYVYYRDYFSGTVFHTKLNGHGSTVFSPGIELDK